MNNQDTMLQVFIQTIEEMDLGMGFTFFVNGQIITGTVISTKKYLKEITENFKMSNNKFANSIGDSFDELLSEEQVNKKQNKDLDFIHMTNATIIDTNNNRINISYPLRLKVSNISGFIIGELQDDN